MCAYTSKIKYNFLKSNEFTFYYINVHFFKDRRNVSKNRELVSHASENFLHKDG